MNIRISVESELPNTEQVLQKFVVIAANRVRERMRERMEETKHGRLYKRRRGEGFTRSHRASAVGESPATDTGKMARSFKVRKLSSMDAIIETNLDYPAILEEKRPLSEPAVNDVLPELENLLVQMLTK